MVVIKLSQEKEKNLCNMNIAEVGFGYERNNQYMFTRNRYIPYGAINQFINERNQYSCFCSAFRYNTTDIDNSLMYGDMYFDFDDVNDFEHVRKDAIVVLNMIEVVFLVKKEWLKIYFSGNKGLHIILPAEILGVIPSAELNCIYKYIANLAKGFTPNKTVDTQIYDNKRLFRIPNTKHEKSGLYKIPITLNELQTLSIDQIREMAVNQRVIEYPIYSELPTANRAYQKIIEEYLRNKEQENKNKNKRYKKTFNFIPPCIQAILENGAQEGERNITIACLAGFYKSYGKTLDETIDLISDWNDNNIKPTGTNELIKTVKSIFNSEKQFGCATLQSLSVCDTTCKVFIKKEEKLNATKQRTDNLSNNDIPVYQKLCRNTIYTRRN